MMYLNIKTYNPNNCILCNANIQLVCYDCFKNYKLFQYQQCVLFHYNLGRYEIDCFYKTVHVIKGYESNFLFSIDEKINMETLINKIDKYNIFS